jgi:MFS family permease
VSHPSAAPPRPEGTRNETQLERYDRNLNELLSELRVALPGVQVLFAFLLVVPFNQRFRSVTPFERDVYLAALLLTLMAAILLVAPTVIHRLHFRLGEKPYVVDTANRLMIAGLAVFALAMSCAVLLVTHYLFGESESIVITAFVVGTFAAVWYVLPLRNRRSCVRPLDPEDRDPAGGATPQAPAVHERKRGGPNGRDQ